MENNWLVLRNNFTNQSGDSPATVSVIIDNLSRLNHVLTKTAATLVTTPMPQLKEGLFVPSETMLFDLNTLNNEDPTFIGATTYNDSTWANHTFDHMPFNASHYDFGAKRDSLMVVVPITVIYMLIFVSGVVGNISTCIVISKNRSMHTATNYYLFSLAISDFLLLISGVPQEMYTIWSKYPYVFGEVFCVLRGLAAETSANATVLTITAFTVERYVAICHPFLSHTMSKLSRAVRLIILVWLISLLTAIPQALQFGIKHDYGIDQCTVVRNLIQHSFELSTFLFFFAPMTLITVLYVLIGLKLRSSSLMKRENGNAWNRHVNSCRQQTSQGTRRVLKMLVAVVVMFFICWAPFHAQRLVAMYGFGTDSLHVYVVTTYISGILYYLSTCINPLLYNIMSNKFREAFKATLAQCLGLTWERNDQKRSYRILSRAQRRRYGAQESTDYSGNSIRDESLYSTSTQKQSIESVTMSRGHSVNHRHYFVRVDSETDTNFTSSIGLEILSPCDELIVNPPTTTADHSDSNNNHSTLSVACLACHHPINSANNHKRFPFYRRNPCKSCNKQIQEPSQIRGSTINTTTNSLKQSSPHNVQQPHQPWVSEIGSTTTKPIPNGGRINGIHLPVFENELDAYMEEIKLREKR